MNISYITMDPAVAQTKLDAYRQQLRKRNDAEYEMAVAGYQALAKGTPLINLLEVFTVAGMGDDHRPKLAIARADRRQVIARAIWGERSHVEFNTARSSRGRFAYGLCIAIEFPREQIKDMKAGYALVPMVPADVRPKGNLRDYFILWEVQAWANRSQMMRPDRDPYLLKHLTGDLYAIIAEWNLTELERAIMAGRREANHGRG